MRTLLTWLLSVPYPWRDAETIQSITVIADDTWQNWVAPVPQTFGKLYLPDAHEGDVPTLYTLNEEDWKVVVLFLSQTQGLYFFAEDDLPIAAVAPSITDDYTWQVILPSAQAQAIQAFATDDEYVLSTLSVDEDYLPLVLSRLGLTPVVYVPPVQPIMDEDAWVPVGTAKYDDLLMLKVTGHVYLTLTGKIKLKL